MNGAAKWAAGLLVPAMIGSACAPRSATPERDALALLPTLESGRPLFAGESVVEALHAMPLSMAEARSLIAKTESAAQSGNLLAAVRLDVARKRFESALEQLQVRGGGLSQETLAVERAAVLLEQSRHSNDVLAAARALESLADEDISQAAIVDRTISFCTLGLERLAGRELDKVSGQLGVSLPIEWPPQLAKCVRASDAQTETAGEGNSITRAAERLENGDSQPLREWLERSGLGGYLQSPTRQTLEVLNRYADSIRQSCGDDNLAKILEVLDSDEEPQRARNGLKGISTWLDADAAVRDFQPEKALAILDAAHSTTSNLSPAIEARLEVARIAALFQLQRYEDAIGAARRLRSVSETRGWNDVVGRASWLAGLSLLQSGQYPAAAAQFLAAEHQFVAGRQPALAANQKSLEADAISELGDLRASLQLRVAALPVLRRAGLRNREANLLSAGSVSLRLSGFPKSAIAFLDEGAAVPTDQSDPLSLAEFRLNRSAALIDAGLMNDAISDAERGLQAADKIESQGIRERTRGYLRAIRGRAEVELEPASAARDLDEAISEASRGDFHAVLGDLYLDRARARRKLGQVAEAVSDLEAAARETVAGVEGIDAMSGRALFLSRKRRLVEEAVSLFALDLGDQEQALRWLQFARDAAAPPARHGADLCSAGSGEFLALMALPRRVARWRCHDGGVSFDSIEIERGALSMTIETFRKQIEGGADEATLAERAGDLFEILLAPIRNEVEAGREVGIFSDGWLAGVPLAAMRDPRTGKWVGELVELPLLAELPMAGGQPPGSARAGWSSLLAVADPEVPEDLVSIFPPLPGARREGEMVARFFPHSLVLSGAEASKKRLLATWTQFDVIHIAAHGVANSVDPGRSGLVLAGTDNNALLTSDEVARLAPLHAQLVVLSACGSGRGYGTSSIGSLSAAAGFLAAGVPDVVGTMWDVDDEISLRFMEAFHRRISQGERPGSALLEARRDLVESGDRKLRVPRNWAGYFLAAGRGQERREG